MPKTTKNFGLIQPEEYENYDIEVQNQNMCKIEEALSKRKEYDPEAMTAEEALKSSIQYTDKKMEDIIGSAPEALDTIYELAAAIKDNEEIIEIIRKAINESAKKEDLTAHENDKTVHVTEQERESWNDSNSRKHDHDNKSILDSITQSLITAWNDAVEHITDGTRHVTSKDKELWNTVSDKAGTDEIITEIKMNGESKGTSGVIDLGTVLTGGNQTAVSADDGGSNVYTFSDGSTINIRNGSKGSKGDTGKNATTTAVATTAANGLMSKDDKIKLDEIETKIKTAVFFVKK